MLMHSARRLFSPSLFGLLSWRWTLRIMTRRANRIRLPAYWRPFAASVRVLVPLALLSALALGATEGSKTVLTIYSDERLLPANLGIGSALAYSPGLETDNPPRYLSEFLDFSRFGSSAYDKLLSDF